MQTTSNMMIYRVLAVVLLAGMGVHHYITVTPPDGVDQYFNRIRLAAQAVPGQIGPWVGQDVRVPVQATTVLKPNVMISRRYVNVETGATAGLMLVHTPDAHHMVGHFPLRCYPAQGWDVRERSERDWTIGDLHLTGMEYQFYMNEEVGELGRSIIVENCLFRPGGRVLRDMDGMTRSIVGAFDSSSGAAQIQVYFDGQVPQERRDQAVAALVAGYEPVLKAILAPAADAK